MYLEKLSKELVMAIKPELDRVHEIAMSEIARLREEVEHSQQRLGKQTEVLVRVSVSLVTALSYVRSTPECKKAAASDKIFEQTLRDWERALDMAKAAMVS